MPTVTVRALAKLNLCLEVLNRRDDGFHSLRTVFQTISLGDVLTVSWQAGAQPARIQVTCNVEIKDNLVQRAAAEVAEAAGIGGHVHLTLRKRIPMGGGLGGGSADAAAVLLALPALAKRPLSHEVLWKIAGRLGSDVPFFLMGGTALGLGRGEELYPLPAARAAHVLLVLPGVHSSTAEAYGALGRATSYSSTENYTSRVADLLWRAAGTVGWVTQCVNDFEGPLFAKHPELAALHQQLVAAGAVGVKMTGSGSAMFAVFDSAWALDRAKGALSVRALRVQFVSRKQYWAKWAQWLESRTSD